MKKKKEREQRIITKYIKAYQKHEIKPTDFSKMCDNIQFNIIQRLLTFIRADVHANTRAQDYFTHRHAHIQEGSQKQNTIYTYIIYIITDLYIILA